ncbi:MAG: hypothetical protein DRH37_02885, partial [Deltaproteobacteria bacterium]
MSNEYVYYNYSNDFFKFLGGSNMANVGDTNGDGYDDLLVASGCWLVFGGRDWSGEVQLSEIGTNGVQLHSLCLEHPVSSAGDMNDDGINDILYSDGQKYLENNNYIYYYHVALVYGRTNWATSFESKNLNGNNGSMLDTTGYAIAIAGNGDINGDGHEDIVVIINDGKTIVQYGGPFLKPRHYPIESSVNNTNGFKIIGFGFDEPDWGKADINGDANGDGYDDILFAVGSSSRPTNYAYLVYGGQSPSAPPALR